MRHMKTIALKTTLLAVSGLGLLATTSTQAMAWGCGNGAPAAYCNTGVTVNQGRAPVFDPMTVNISQPMGYLRTVDYQRAPNVSITRVHGMMASAALSDFPSNFTQGCHPTSTTYCRQDMGTPVNVQFNAAPMPAGNFNVGNFNFAQPARMAPVISAPQFTGSRIVAIGGGYDTSKFAPRVYGNNTFTPGIAHVPTSYVDRSPVNAANALAAAGYSTRGYSMGGYNLGAPSTTIMASGNALLAGGPTYAQNLSLSPVASNPFPLGSPVGNDNPTSPVDATGGYWEKVSGLTMFGSTVATSVVCRRQAPRPLPRPVPRVVRPVVGVPVPVPTPVPYYVDVPITVHGQGMPNGCRPAGSPAPMMRPAMPMRPMMRPTMPMRPIMRPGMHQGFGPRFGGGFAPQMRPQMHQGMNTGWTF